MAGSPQDESQEESDLEHSGGMILNTVETTNGQPYDVNLE